MTFGAPLPRRNLTKPDIGPEPLLIIWTSGLKETVEELPSLAASRVRRRGGIMQEPGSREIFVPTKKVERVPFDAHLGFPAAFVDLAVRAVNGDREVGYPFRRATDLPPNCPTADHGREKLRQRKGQL